MLISGRPGTDRSGTTPHTFQQHWFTDPVTLGRYSSLPTSGVEHSGFLTKHFLIYVTDNEVSQNITAPQQM